MTTVICTAYHYDLGLDDDDARLVESPEESFTAHSMIAAVYEMSERSRHIEEQDAVMYTVKIKDE